MARRRMGQRPFLRSILRMFRRINEVAHGDKCSDEWGRGVLRIPGEGRETWGGG